jgi:hypothetical protein
MLDMTMTGLRTTPDLPLNNARCTPTEDRGRNKRA